MNKVQEKRLLNVAKALRDSNALSKKYFTMATYIHGPNPLDDYGNQIPCKQNICGTPACALGHYAARTDLQRLLKVEYFKNDDGEEDADLGWFGSDDGLYISYADTPILEHFGISVDEACELFSSEGCGGATTPIQAAKYIEKFVKQKRHPGRH